MRRYTKEELYACARRSGGPPLPVTALPEVFVAARQLPAGAAAAAAAAPVAAAHTPAPARAAGGGGVAGGGARSLGFQPSAQSFATHFGVQVVEDERRPRRAAAPAAPPPAKPAPPQRASGGEGGGKVDAGFRQGGLFDASPFPADGATRRTRDDFAEWEQRHFNSATKFHTGGDDDPGVDWMRPAKAHGRRDSPARRAAPTDEVLDAASFEQRLMSEASAQKGQSAQEIEPAPQGERRGGSRFLGMFQSQQPQEAAAAGPTARQDYADPSPMMDAASLEAQLFSSAPEQQDAASFEAKLFSDAQRAQQQQRAAAAPAPAPVPVPVPAPAAVPAAPQPRSPPVAPRPGAGALVDAVSLEQALLQQAGAQRQPQPVAAPVAPPAVAAPAAAPMQQAVAAGVLDAVEFERRLLSQASKQNNSTPPPSRQQPQPPPQPQPQPQHIQAPPGLVMVQQPMHPFVQAHPQQILVTQDMLQQQFQNQQQAQQQLQQQQLQKQFQQQQQQALMSVGVAPIGLRPAST